MHDPERDADSPSSALSDRLVPPAHLEDRVVARLRERGLLSPASNPRRIWMLVGWAASLLVAYGLGIASRGDRPDGTHLLFLERGDDALASGAELEERIDEYAAWARELESAGVLVAAERLQPGGWLLNENERELNESEPMEAPSGFFLLSAESDAEARRVAASCPHLAHGGAARLRSIARR